MTGPLVVSTAAVVEPTGQVVAAFWCYDPDDPYAVMLRLRSGRDAWVEWVFARELLAEGLFFAVGLGDVRLEPFPGDGLLVTLDSPSGHALLRLDAAHAARVLTGSFELVRRGCEEVDWDLALELLAAEEAWHDGGLRAAESRETGLAGPETRTDPSSAPDDASGGLR